MESRVLKRGAVEMSVVCSDLSLLESINSLLLQKGIISIEDEYGVLHYIVDGRSNRKEVAGKITSLSSGSKDSAELAKEDAYIELCVKSVLREYGFDLSLTGTELIYRTVVNSFRKGKPLPPTMKAMYYESGKEHRLSYEQSERDVRYAITKSNLKNMRSRSALRCIHGRIERRLGFRDPLD